MQCLVRATREKLDLRHQSSSAHPDGCHQSGDDGRINHLIKTYLSGDDHAFTELVKLYRGYVVNLAGSFVKDRDESLDVAQLAFVKLSRGLHQFDTSKKFSTWLYSVVRNAAADYRRAQRRHRHESIEYHANSPASLTSDPEHMYYCHELREELDRASSRLRPRDRVVFSLRHLEGERVTDIAHSLGFPVSAIRFYLQRARISMMRELRRARVAPLLS